MVADDAQRSPELVLRVNGGEETEDLRELRSAPLASTRYL